jgi:hypothetical protein
VFSIARFPLGYSSLWCKAGLSVAQQEFKPEYMARKMIRLYPDLASEIALSLMHDAIRIGESRRAELWREVLARIGRLQQKKRGPLN